MSNASVPLGLKDERLVIATDLLKELRRWRHADDLCFEDMNAMAIKAHYALLEIERLSYIFDGGNP